MLSKIIQNKYPRLYDAGSFLRRNDYKIVGAVLFSFYLLTIISTTVIMVHNSPLNTVTNQSENGDAFTDASSKLQEANKRPGLTFGKVDKPVKDQIQTITGHIISSNRFIFLVALLSVALFGVFSGLQKYIQPPLLIPILLSILCYYFGVLAIFEFTPQIHFLTSDWNSESVRWATQNERLVPKFALLIFLQSLIVSSVPLLWTQPIMPEYHSHEALRIHLNNWRKYGSWLATVLGGVLLTGILIL